MAGENYRRVVPSFWTDPDLKRKFTLGQKALLLYFFTSPHSNMIGLYFLPLEYVAAETGLSVEDIRRDLVGVLAPFVSYDEETEEVLVRRAAFHQMGELHGADKRKEGVRRLLEGIHSARLKRAFLEEYAGWDLGVKPPDTRKKPLTKPLTKPLSDAAEGAIQAIAVAVAATGAATELRPPGGGWPGEFASLYEKIGIVSPGQIGKTLKPVVDRYGVDRTREMWAYYIRHAPGLRFGQLEKGHWDTSRMSPADFVKNAGTWYAKTQPIGGPDAVTAS